jgi:glycosyltransferase involved in cell wall biosynthesis
MKQLCIGVHCHEQPERLLATLESVRRNTASTVRLILLPDGPDARMRRALRDLSDIPQFGSEEPLGTAACFNRLAAASQAEVVVLLESGSQVGPDWLERLLAALEAGPRNGLAGPTTNYAWNEQCVYWGSGDSADEIARAAQAAATRFGNETRVLEPLYSLADFCYAVRREVIEDVGAADESYSLGPCWEMDYNIRAARAGWRGVWACAAYVHRTPFTARRQSEEERRFEASKRHYQDKFCGARLRGEKTDYRVHCRGDACPNFAPATLIEIKRPLAAGTKRIEDRGSRIENRLPRSASILDPRSSILDFSEEEAPREVLSVAGDPLVSCIMPTCNRRRFIPQAIRRFLRQDYPNLELVVVDDGAESVADCMPEHPRIRYFRLDQKLTVGAKRNFACRQARGEFIAHWDDDDWYADSRVGAQLKALLASSADVCGSSRMYFYAPATEQAWEYCYSAPGPAWVGGTTLVYRKQAWERGPFPDLQVGEDSHFVCYGGGKTICDLAEAELCVAVVHAGNTSCKDTAGAFWRQQPGERIERLLGADLDVYRALLGPFDSGRWPLISCIMPTYNRRPFLPLALRCFLDQDYPNKELIVVDDGEDRVGDLAENLPGVRYFSPASRLSIGAKRNLACAEARGEIVAHWDDDDWYATDRLRYQAAPIIAGEAEITGLESAFVLDAAESAFWTIKPELHRRLFAGDVHGGTLVYRRELLSRGLRYPEVSLAEDAYLLRQAIEGGMRLLRLDNPGVFVYVRHGLNAWREFEPGRFLAPAGWMPAHPPLTLPAAARLAYQTAALGSIQYLNS